METAAQLTRAPAPSGAQWTISADGHEAVVVEVGGGLRAYSVAGVDLVHRYDDSEICPGSAGQVLAPWPNRIRDGQYAFGDVKYQLPLTEPDRGNAIHGLVNWARWHVVESSAAAVTVEYELVPTAGYPWSLLLRTTWSVGSDGLRAAHEVSNLSTQPCPFGFAPHPYLQVPDVAVDDLLLRVPGHSRLLVDSRQLPIGATRVAGGELDYTEPRRIGNAVLDTAFGEVDHASDGTSEVTLTGPTGEGVGVWADRAFIWWQVYTGDTLAPDRRRRSVAVEPMTCPPDAYRSGRDLIVLQPGETWTASWGIRPLSAPADGDG
ncbi:MAG TPA: aldose 1-epimerase family protein [Micromonosporaceae bacterium]|nr:aldose 1-epimerase family protein [Micromonosporaceae bacterium]